MKTWFVLFVLIFLSACGGGQQTSTTLEVTSSALTASNSSYEGGLVIMGKSGTQNFTIPIGQSGSSGNRVTIELTKGVWNFSAVAWDNINSPFSGTNLCDDVVVDINQDVQSVSLALTAEKCAGTKFGASNYRNGGAFKTLRIVTCGTLYTDANVAVPISSSTPYAYCTSSGALPVYRRDHAQSVKLEIPRIINGNISQGISHCYTTGSEGVFGGTKQIPSSGLPIHVTLYENSTCDGTDLEEIKGRYVFPQGIANAVAKQDSFLNDHTLGTNLYLPFNSIKKGYSSFLAILPQIKCSGANCTPLPTAIPSSSARVFIDNRDFVLVENPSPVQACANIGSTSYSGFSSLTFTSGADCREEDGKLIGRITTGGSTTGSMTITWTDLSTTTISLAKDDTVRLYDTLFRAFGYPSTGGAPIPEIMNSFETLFREEDSQEFGILGKVRDMFEVDGPGGLFGAGSCALGARKEEIVSLFEEGNWKTYRVILVDSSNLVSVIEDDATYTAGTQYQKRLIAQRKDANGVFHTEMTMDFMCDRKMGIYESYETHADGWIERKKTYWNTESATDALMENYEYHKKVVSGVLEDYFGEIIKLGNPSDATTADVNRFSLNMKNVGGGNYSYHSLKQRVYVVSTDKMALLEVADQQPSLSGISASYSSAITSAAPAIKFCSSFTSPNFSIIASDASYGSGCAGYPSSYDVSIDWNGLLPNNFEGMFTPVNTFTAID